MIEQHEVLQLLLEACPSYSNDAREHVAEHGSDLLFVAAGAFARHLLVLHQQGDVASLRKAAAAIERLHVEGSPWVKEYATVGLLEGLQNNWSNSQVDPELFRQYLGPESLRWWEGLNRFWFGAAPSVKGKA